MPKLADRVKETSTTTGTGTYNLGGAATGFRAFSAAFATGDTVYYCVEDGTDWEVGIGTLTTGTPWTLARTTILASSNAGAAVNWAAGTRNVFCTSPASVLSDIQSQTYTAFTSAGTATAYTLTPTPAIAANAANLRFNVTLHTIPGDCPTLSVSGKSALPLGFFNAGGRKQAISSTQVPVANWISDIISDGTNWLLMQVASNAAAAGTLRAIFGYGRTGGQLSMTNLVSGVGVVAADVTGVGTARYYLAAAGYGGDKAIFGYGYTSANTAITNLVSSTGVVATDTTGVGTARANLAAAGYGGDKAIFGYGYVAASSSLTNLVSSAGVVATDTAGVGTARYDLAAAGYGTDKAIFGYGSGSLTNLVSNSGVVATDTAGVGTNRDRLAAARYGTDKAIFGYGQAAGVSSLTNLVSNTGVVATDTTGVGSARRELAAAGYGTDKAIFGYGYTNIETAITNLVSNTGVVATDTAGVGTARSTLAAAGYALI